MMSTMRTFGTATVVAVLVATGGLLAHPMTFKGTVAAVERTRLQVKTGEEKKNEAPPWLLIDDKTKILRDKTVVTFDQAKITVGEKTVVNVDHGADGVMKAVEIHLAAK